MDHHHHHHPYHRPDNRHPYGEEFLTETEGEVGGKLVYMLAEPEGKRSRAADGDGQAMPCSDALPGMTDHQGHASPRKLPHRLPTAYAPAPAPEDMVKFNLERCNLALLHQQNTGRLFIVLFEKKKKLLSEVFRCRRPAKRNHSKRS
ncbi:hypothetical protein quinque_014983 [Culex quinquefasciatus]